MKKVLKSDYLVFKRYTFNSVQVINGYSIIATTAEVGMIRSKMVTGISISSFNGIPSSNNFMLNVYNAYGTNIIAVSNVSQKLSFTINWIETI